jgi:hypothetical protein
MKQIVAVLFMLFFCVYTVSPLHYAEVTALEGAPCSEGSRHGQTSHRLFLLEVLLAHVFGSSEQVDTSLPVGVLTKKRKAVVSSQPPANLGPEEQRPLPTHLTSEYRHDSISIAPYESPAHPLKGFHLLVSGLSPPC